MDDALFDNDNIIEAQRNRIAELEAEVVRLRTSDAVAVDGDGEPVRADSAQDRIAELEAEVSKARAEERKAIVAVLRLFIDEVIHTSHADGLGMGDQFREAVIAECIQRIQRRAQEASDD